ncbi:MAG: hypothetical protein KQH59_03615 [Desulfobulbaceae bacterium]|nr:hypothetical protein [Desulfobulbaceae bacterium]
MRRNVERLTNAKSNPSKYPYTYETLRKKYYLGEMRGIIFKFSGRLWFDHDAWDEKLDNARENSK